MVIKFDKYMAVVWDLTAAERAIIAALVKAENERSEILLRNDVCPPVRGDITPGKLRWRGIRICVEAATGEKYLYQRETLIGIINPPYAVLNRPDVHIRINP